MPTTQIRQHVLEQRQTLSQKSCSAAMPTILQLHMAPRTSFQPHLHQQHRMFSQRSRSSTPRQRLERLWNGNPETTRKYVPNRPNHHRNGIEQMIFTMVLWQLLISTVWDIGNSIYNTRSEDKQDDMSQAKEDTSTQEKISDSGAMLKDWGL